MEVLKKEEKEMEILYEKEKEGKSINGTIHKITVINSNSFYIGDTRNFGKYIRNGIAKNLKIPIKMQFKPFEKCINTKEIPFDENMKIHDFMKFNSSEILHVAFDTLDLFR